VPEVLTFTRHLDKNGGAEVWVVAVSLDGAQTLSASNDGKILLWNTAEGNDGPLTPFSDNDDPVGGLAFLPELGTDGKAEFISTHPHGDINLWSVGRSKPILRFSHKNSDPVNSVAIARDGSFFISGSFDRTLRVWDLAHRKSNSRPLRILTGHKSWVWRVAISDDMNFAASAGEDGLVYVWDLNANGPIRTRSTEPLTPSKTFGPFGPFVDGSMGVTFVTNSRIAYSARGLLSAQAVESKGPG
jgi:WD40 repeat protein